MGSLWVIAIISFLDVAVFAVYCQRFSDRKFENSSVYILTFVILFVLNFAVSSVEMEVYLRMAFNLVFLISFYCLMYDGTLPGKAFAAILFFLFINQGETLAMTIVFFALKQTYISVENQQQALYMTIALLSKAITFVVVLIITKNKKSRFARIPIQYLIILVSVPLCCMFISYEHVALVFLTTPQANLEAVLVELVLLFLSVVAFVVFDKLMLDAEREKLHVIQEQQLLQYETEFRQLEEQQNTLRRFRHDFDNLLLSIKVLTEQRKTDEVLSAVNDVLCSHESIQTESITYIPMIDVILNAKISKAKGLGIVVSVFPKPLPTLQINPLYINMILSNALDNAIEACSAITDRIERQIDVQISFEGNYLYIRVDNPSRPVRIQTDGAIPTQKKDKSLHGFGLVSIREAARRYDGNSVCAYQHGRFSLMVMMKNVEV